MVGAVDSGFFRTFDFEIKEGNAQNIFPNINSISLTESTAEKLFGGKQAIGQTVIYQKTNFTVTGILKDFPENSSIRFDALVPMSFYAKLFTDWGGNGNWKTIDEDMGNYSFDTYVLLQGGANADKTGKAFTDLYKQARNGDSDASFTLQRLDDIHLIGADGNKTAQRMVQIFLLVVVLLLAIASINYVNLSTARALARAKEVSVRKIIGADKKQLFFQFTLETILLFCFATAFAILIIYLLMPLYNDISGKTLAFDITSSSVWQPAGAAILGTLVVSSIYPAFLLSSFRPIESLKGKFKLGFGTASIRKGLVVFQFSISIVLLVCTIIMSGQMDYMKKKDLGYDKSYVFTMPVPEKMHDHLESVKAELKKNTSIIDVAVASDNISNLQSSTGDLDWPGRPENNKPIISQFYTDKDFIPTMRMKFAEGGNFTGTPADSAYYILNETAVEKMGLKKPYIGKQISFHDRKGTIKGVVKDFNFQSLKEKITPIIFYHFWNSSNLLYVRTNGSGAQSAIALAEQQYKKYSSDTPFSYNFLDKSFESLYKSEQRSGLLFNLFAGIAIFISCLGLFGLSTYTAQVKTKEIGIRKVLGASVSAIVQLISKDFMKLVFVSVLIATPVAWWAVNKWLQNFAYRINIQWWVFLLAGFIALLIALVTISFQAIKAAVANPVKSIRTE